MGVEVVGDDIGCVVEAETDNEEEPAEVEPTGVCFVVRKKAGTQGRFAGVVGCCCGDGAAE